jgi:hypothetical protein
MVSNWAWPNVLPRYQMLYLCTKLHTHVCKYFQHTCKAILRARVADGIFSYQKSQFGNALEWITLVYLLVFWNILRPFVISCEILVMLWSFANYFYVYFYVSTFLLATLASRRLLPPALLQMGFPISRFFMCLPTYISASWSNPTTTATFTTTTTLALHILAKIHQFRHKNKHQSNIGLRENRET